MVSLRMAYLLWLPSLFGVAGLQRLYMGKIGTGVLYLLTQGLFGLGTLYDLFTLPDQVREVRLKERYRQALDHDLDRLNARIGYRYRQAPSAYSGGEAGGASGRRRETLEHTILRVAKKNKGIATPAEVALEGDVSADDAKAQLDRLAEKGFAEVRVRKSGHLAYVFPDFLEEDDASKWEDV